MNSQLSQLILESIRMQMSIFNCFDSLVTSRRRLIHGTENVGVAVACPGVHFLGAEGGQRFTSRRGHSFLSE